MAQRAFRLCFQLILFWLVFCCVYSKRQNNEEQQSGKEIEMLLNFFPDIENDRNKRFENRPSTEMVRTEGKEGGEDEAPNQVLPQETENFSNSGQKDTLFDSIPEFADQIVRLLTGKRDRERRLQTVNQPKKRDEMINIQVQQPVEQTFTKDRLNKLYRKLAKKLAEITKRKNIIDPTMLKKLRLAAKERVMPTLPPEAKEALKDVTLENLFKCDDYQKETKTCWFERQLGASLTLSAQLTGAEMLSWHEGYVFVQWERHHHNLKPSKDSFQKIYSGVNDSDDHLVVGSGGLRISPITDMDIDYNSFRASAMVTAPKLEPEGIQLCEINFKINIMPIDMGYVYMGEEITIHIEDFITLPSHHLNIKWIKEISQSELEQLPPNMRVKNHGKTLIISELSKPQQGILACIIYSVDNFFVAKRRFLIREPMLPQLPQLPRSSNKNTPQTLLDTHKPLLNISVKL